MRRDVQSVVLVLVGGALLRISVTDVYLRYVKEGMRPWLVASGALLVVLGLLLLADVLRAGGRAEPHERRAHGQADQVAGAGEPPVVDDDDAGHGPASAWLLLLPVAAIFLVAPPALGAFTAARQPSVVTQPKEPAAPPLPPGNPVSVSLADYAARAVWDDGRTLVGRTVKLTGFVTPNPAGGWWLTRLQLSCCAADATATKISPIDPPAFSANAWVQVVGTWEPGGGTQSATAIPLVRIERITPVPAPANPYE